MNETFTYTEMPSKGIVQIPTALLHHHPDNPRKDLGDVSELAASIKAKGVMQNLTVVPYRDGGGTGCYYVVIGNRRLEAARQAKLATLPCIIVQMTKAEQVQTMLLENMQRVDLTVYEQAQGFRQLQIDFGMSAAEISRQVGFSATTVRRRLKMAELDPDALRRVSDRQLSLEDFDRLAEIEDMADRNEVLAFIGTNNFQWYLKQKLDAQQQRRLRERWRQVLLAAGLVEVQEGDPALAPLDGPAGTSLRIDTGDPEGFDATAYAGEGHGFYFAYGNWLYFRRPKAQKADEVDEEAERRKAERKARLERLDEAFERADALRRDFIRSVNEGDARHHAPKAIAAIALCPTYERYWLELCELLECEEEQLPEYAANAPYRMAVLMGFVAKDGNACPVCFDRYDGEYRPDERLKELYDYLRSLGYEISTEERALLDGTSELYAREVE